MSGGGQHVALDEQHRPGGRSATGSTPSSSATKLLAVGADLVRVCCAASASWGCGPKSHAQLERRAEPELRFRFRWRCFGGEIVGHLARGRPGICLASDPSVGPNPAARCRPSATPPAWRLTAARWLSGKSHAVRSAAVRLSPEGPRRSPRVESVRQRSDGLRRTAPSSSEGSPAGTVPAWRVPSSSRADRGEVGRSGLRRAAPRARHGRQGARHGASRRGAQPLGGDALTIVPPAAVGCGRRRGTSSRIRRRNLF